MYHKNLSLPLLKILNASSVLVKELTRLIGNTIGNLNEIKIDQINHDDDDNKKIIQIIYLNCPNLKYLKSLIRNCNILELENLLINCQNLIGLYILTSDIINWDELFKILLRSSSNNLFKFKFLTRISIKFDSLKYFLDNWDKDRHPLLLQTIRMFENQSLSYLIHEYKIKGIVMKYDNDWYGTNFRTFEWI
ncbi:hypothetical protein GLOIN_2v498954 [Rhizophagus clarus]|uniref:Uncharacterized protein n=1 Tax=Rhizophagus clarus TaxID=94130 RepID=A0A8H3KV36_9GLOM|nr:hypothetical protein GLOIN_2v498954 [Rhizophagus clarus]